MNIYNINCKIVETEINVSDELKNLVNQFKLEDDFTSFKDKDNANKLSDFIGTHYQKRLIDIIKCFTDIKKLASVKISHSWVQRYNNKRHNCHIHGTDNDKLSFVWYIDASPKSSPIIFYNPGYPYINYWTKEIMPLKNKFLIFNSYIPHEVAINRDNARIVVSGNIDLLWRK